MERICGVRNSLFREKEFVNLYRHRDFGSRLIEVTKMLGKVEITDTKN